MGEMWDIRMGLPDGRQAVLVGDGVHDEWYVVGKDGLPDWDQPVDPRELGIKPLPTAAPPSPKDDSAEAGQP